MVHVHFAERAIFELALIENHIIQANVESGILVRYIEFVVLKYRETALARANAALASAKLDLLCILQPHSVHRSTLRARGRGK